jgi:RHS repeat-associated protein
MLRWSDVFVHTAWVANYTTGPEDGQTQAQWGHSTSIGYTGQHLDDTGLLYYHARYYDPGLARFISPDGVGAGCFER